MEAKAAVLYTKFSAKYISMKQTYKGNVSAIHGKICLMRLGSLFKQRHDPVAEMNKPLQMNVCEVLVTPHGCERKHRLELL